MMNKKRLMAILAAGVLTATSFNPAMIKAESVSAEEAGMAVPADAAGMSVPADAAGAKGGRARLHCVFQCGAAGYGGKTAPEYGGVFGGLRRGPGKGPAIWRPISACDSHLGAAGHRYCGRLRKDSSRSKRARGIFWVIG